MLRASCVWEDIVYNLLPLLISKRAGEFPVNGCLPTYQQMGYNPTCNYSHLTLLAACWGALSPGDDKSMSSYSQPASVSA